MDEHCDVGDRTEGASHRRHVLGQGEFAADLQRPSQMYAAFVRSGVGHAEIEAVETASAENLDGVDRVWTAEDVADRVPDRYGVPAADKELLASDRAIYHGQPVAVVLGRTRAAAERGADEVEVEYETLPAVTSIDDALAEDAPTIHPDKSNSTVPDRFAAEGGDGRTNVAFRDGFAVGDPEEALAEADVVVSETFETAPTTPAPMEPRGCIAEYDVGRDRLTMWSSTQTPRNLRTVLGALVDGLSEDRIVCKQPDVGGGFGLKLNVFPHEICAALLSMETGNPVKSVFDREAEFLAGGRRQNERLRGRLGVDSDGRFTALSVERVQNTGAYCESGPAVVHTSTVSGAGPYPIPNQRWTYEGVYTNTVPGVPVRGFGDMNVTFMREQLVDVAAERLGVDPTELRQRNLPSQSSMPRRSPTGIEWRNSDPLACLDAVTELEASDAESGRTYRGVGTAAITKTSGNKAPKPGNFESVTVKADRTGTVWVYTPMIEIGQGTETAILQAVAGELGLARENVQLVTGDTDVTPEGRGAWGDRGAIAGVTAGTRAARDLRETLDAVAARYFDARPDQIRLRDGVAAVEGREDATLPIRELIQVALTADDEVLGPPAERPPELRRGLSLTGHGTYRPERAEYADEDGLGNVFTGCTFGALSVEVEVDGATGDVSVVDVAASFDVGKALNPSLVEGQVQGGVAQAMSETLSQRLSFDSEGRLETRSFTTYHLPTATDVPMITSIELVENPDPETSHGQRGVGEAPVVPVPAAIANAVADAVGVRPTSLPVSNEEILSALDD